MHDLVYLVFIIDVKMIVVKTNLSIYRIPFRFGQTINAICSKKEKSPILRKGHGG